MAKKNSLSPRVANNSVEDVAHAELPTRYGRFTIHGFRGAGPQDEAVALVRGKVRGPFKSRKLAPLVSVNSQCLTGDVLTSQRCGCRPQLGLCIERISQAHSRLPLDLT